MPERTLPQVVAQCFFGVGPGKRVHRDDRGAFKDALERIEQLDAEPVEVQLAHAKTVIAQQTSRGDAAWNLTPATFCRHWPTFRPNTRESLEELYRIWLADNQWETVSLSAPCIFLSVRGPNLPESWKPVARHWYKEVWKKLSEKEQRRVQRIVAGYGGQMLMECAK